MSLYSRLDRLAADVEKLNRQVTAVANSPQSQRTSVEGGSIDFNDADGNLMAIMGGQDDGSNTIRHVDGPTPPIPSGLSAHVDGPIVQVSWDGTFEDADTATWDWSHLEVIVVGPGNEQLTATINDVTGATANLAATASGEWTVVARSVSRAEKRSLDGDAGTVTVELVGLTGAINDAIGSANGKNTVTYSETPPGPEDEGIDGDTWFVNSVDPETSIMLITEQWQYLDGAWVQTELDHQVIATVDLGKATVGELDGIRIMGQTIHGEQLSGDAIDGKVITGATIQSGRSGRRWVGDPNGIRIINDDDDVRTQLSPDGSTFKGEVEADTLVVNEGAEFKGNNTLAQGSKLTLAAGVTDPVAPPVVQPYWDGVEFDMSLSASANLSGLAFDGTNYWTVKTTGAWIVNGVNGLRAIRITPTGGHDLYSLDGGSQGFSEFFGVTCIGSELFWLYRSGYKAYVLVTDLSCNKLREWEYPALGYGPGNPLAYKPGIGNDGTNIVIGQCLDNGSLVFRTYDKTTGAGLGSIDRGDATKSDITGVYVGNGDLGTKYVLVAKKSTNTIQVFGTDGSATNHSWYTENGDVGIVFHDGTFHTLNPAGIVHEYADTNTGDNSGDWWAAYRWYKYVGQLPLVAFVSRISSATRFSWPRRAKLKIMGQPLPVGVPTIEPVLAKKTATPGRTDFRVVPAQMRAGTSTTWYDSLPADWLNKAVPTGSNTFPEAESSALESASGTFQVKGDGSGHWGPITWNSDGTIRGATEAGTAIVPINAANSNRTLAVTFTTGRFKTPPTVVATPVTPDPQTVQVSVNNITATGFTMVARRTVASNAYVTWVATEG